MNDCALDVWAAVDEKRIDIGMRDSDHAASDSSIAYGSPAILITSTIVEKRGFVASAVLSLRLQIANVIFVTTTKRMCVCIFVLETQKQEL